jgi:two-component system, OmpR family, KDP operon response regulator KdpE
MLVLLVSSDAQFRDVTSYALARHGFGVVTASTAADALRRWEAEQPHLVLLDTGDSWWNDLAVCRRIRATSLVPVVVLGSGTDDTLAVAAFQAGADDVVTKPLSLRQLAWRIRTVWRRGARAGQPQPAVQLRLGDLTLDFGSQEATYRDRVARLTPTEFRLLHLLAMNAGRVVSASRLMDYAWLYAGTTPPRLRSHVCQLRRKLGLNGGGLICLPGVGYRLANEMAGPGTLDGGRAI